MRDGLWFGDAVLVAVGAADPVDVVGTFGAGESRVHFFDVDAAVGHLRVAGFAGGGCVLVVSGVAGEATDALVNTDGRAVVAGADLRAVVIGGSDGVGLRLARRVALIAERLALIGADFYCAWAVGELRKSRAGGSAKCICSRRSNIARESVADGGVAEIRVKALFARLLRDASGGRPCRASWAGQRSWRA